jgi:DUF4097 and DUF4098 domain-containing protein YvlB
MTEFDCPNPVPVEVKLGGGALEIVAEPRDTASVRVSPWDDSEAARQAAERTTVELRDGRLVIEAHDSITLWLLRNVGVRVDLRVPPDCPLTIKVASADVRCGGRYGELRLTTASGDVAVEHVTAGRVDRGVAGHVLVERIDGRATVRGASGDVTVTRAYGDISGGTASGDLTVEEAAGSVKVTTGSGDLRVGCVRGGTVLLKSASGAVSVGVAQGTSVWLDVATASGRTRNGLTMDANPPANSGAQLDLAIRTASGDVDIHRVAMPAAA